MHVKSVVGAVVAWVAVVVAPASSVRGAWAGAGEAGPPSVAALGLEIQEPLVMEATGLVEEGKFDDAVEKLTAALKDKTRQDDDRRRHELHLGLAIVHIRNGALSKARPLLLDLGKQDERSVLSRQAQVLTVVADKAPKNNKAAEAPYKTRESWRRAMLVVRRELEKDMKKDHDAIKAAVKADQWETIKSKLERTRDLAERIDVIEIEEEGHADQDILRDHALALASEVEAMNRHVQEHMERVRALQGSMEQVKNRKGKVIGWGPYNQVKEYNNLCEQIRMAHEAGNDLIQAYHDEQRAYPKRIKYDDAVKIWLKPKDRPKPREVAP